VVSCLTTTGTPHGCLRALRAEAEEAEPESARNARHLAANFAELVRKVADESSNFVVAGHNDLA
jgi:hypothetical protein